MLFIHIPKTAGTSFRKSAEQYFKKAYVAYDYSLNSPETSSVIRENIYEKNDPLLLSDQLKKFEIKFLSGHVPASKYINILGVRDTVTFLRDPVQRIVSEYQHFVRHNNYTDDLKSFYRKPQFINRQKKMLQGIPIKSIGYLGLTEHYNDSLKGINRHFQLELPNLELNMGRKDKSACYGLDEETLKEITEINKEDILLYEESSEIFIERKRIEKEGFSYVHGDIQQTTKKFISGWAYYSSNDEPASVTILKNGTTVGQVDAKDLRPGLLWLTPPRKGYIGFHFNFDTPCKEGDEISCVIKESNQVLGTRLIKQAS